MSKSIQVNRTTNETQIELTMQLYGTGKSSISTGIGFMDHMLNLFAFFSQLDLDIRATGDLDVDSHHLVEDLGLVLGGAIKQALNKNGIRRYGQVLQPMDEALARVVIDFSGRSYLVFNCNFVRQDLGSLDVQNIQEFFKSFCNEAGITLHLDLLYGDNDHHKAEALFKGFGRAVKEAIQIVSSELPSTKGVL